MQRHIKLLFILSTLISLDVRGQNPLIIDHHCVNIYELDEEEVIQAKEKLHVGYGHTSHGSQLISGMHSIYDNFGASFAFSSLVANDESLELFEGDGYGSGELDHDVGYFPNWINETKAFLDNPLNKRFNVIMWSWCGQLSGYTSEEVIEKYLDPMVALELDYPRITFVYMTGHLDGTKETGPLHINNETIREFCYSNGKVLFDFADIESFDPDGNSYLKKGATESCQYDGDNDGSREGNWAREWCVDNPEKCFYSGACAHSLPLNCQLKGVAAWWLFAKIATRNSTTIQVNSDENSIYFYFDSKKTLVAKGNIGGLDGQLRIFSLTGEMIFCKCLNAAETLHIDAEFLSQGIYIIELLGKDFSLTQKIILQ